MVRATMHPLTDHRIRQFDETYQTFFYINPTTNPPTTSWTRPGLPEGEIHPEQSDAYQFAQSDHGQGAAGDYLNAGSTDSPVPSGPGYNSDPNGQTAAPGGDGERGLGSMIGGLMGKQSGYGNQSYGGYGNQGYNQYV